MKDHYRVLVVGGGTGGLMVASQLMQHEDDLDIAIIEPSDKHYYQPLWTLIGGGVFPKEESERDEADFIPDGAEWIQDAVTELHPDENRVTLKGGESVGYDFLVMAAGIKLDWDAIPGVTEALHQPGNGVVSNYLYDTCEKTWEAIEAFPQGGTAIFTEPTTGVKCGGAPQKIMYLADDAFRRNGVRDGSRIAFMKAKGKLFSSPKYERTLYDVVKRKDIELNLMTELIELRADQNEAVFKNLETGEEHTEHYDMIHVVPPMIAPDFISQSPLADNEGWVDVDPGTLRHNRYENVFGLGDNSNLPTSKTGAAIRKQAPVVVDHLLAALQNRKPLNGRYTGYTSCPLVTGYGKLVLAEFDYDKNPMESFPFDQSQERYSMYALKAYGLPRMYWNGMLRGRM
ncbi:pyridine nucleotide-disulfide oxidoreductase [Longibacter salinarum]|uniref:Pyridine nucleotide-disulfide oxidoreductase n=1 Tax=Longibacter salinarum TaxID=1850348 RepID=A0A2A8CYK6_9BACT|nr:FAD/NAD(P)-binding oxidoreductase [Longibacter salinarum]PEN13802.1 pyridine nucleotide-disulfide oxidoreductase [Longibacter salinarum]